MVERMAEARRSRWKVRKAEVVGKDKIKLTIEDNPTIGDTPFYDYPRNAPQPPPPFSGDGWRWVAVSEELIKDMRAKWSPPIQVRIVGGIGEDILEMEMRKPSRDWPYD